MRLVFGRLLFQSPNSRTPMGGQAEAKLQETTVAFSNKSARFRVIYGPTDDVVATPIITKQNHTEQHITSQQAQTENTIQQP